MFINRVILYVAKNILTGTKVIKTHYLCTLKTKKYDKRLD